MIKKKITEKKLIYFYLDLLQVQLIFEKHQRNLY